MVINGLSGDPAVNKIQTGQKPPRVNMIDTSLLSCCEPNHCWERRSVSLPIIEEEKESERLLPLIRGGGIWAAGGSWFLVEPHRSCLGSDTNYWPLPAPFPWWRHHLLLLHTEATAPVSRCSEDFCCFVEKCYCSANRFMLPTVAPVCLVYIP